MNTPVARWPGGILVDAAVVADGCAAGGAVGLLCSTGAGVVRMTLAVFAGGLTGPPPSMGWWWTALTVASVVDVVAVAVSVAAWRSEGGGTACRHFLRDS